MYYLKELTYSRLFVECVLGNVAPFFDKRDHSSFVGDGTFIRKVLIIVQYLIVRDQYRAQFLHGQEYDVSHEEIFHKCV